MGMARGSGYVDEDPGEHEVEVAMLYGQRWRRESNLFIEGLVTEGRL